MTDRATKPMAAKMNGGSETNANCTPKARNASIGKDLGRAKLHKGSGSPIKTVR